jgi:hypothetical protein
VKYGSLRRKWFSPKLRMRPEIDGEEESGRLVPGFNHRIARVVPVWPSPLERRKSRPKGQFLGRPKSIATFSGQAAMASFGSEIDLLFKSISNFMQFSNNFAFSGKRF